MPEEYSLQTKAQAEPAGTLSADASSCANCGETCRGPYCSACGQRQLRGRHTLRGLARGIVDRVFNAEAGLIHTAIQLTVRPGGMIQEYLAGRTVRYMHPAAYVLVSAGAFALSTRLFAGSTGAGEGDRIFTLLLIPLVAAGSRVLSWRGRYNYAEHLIAVMYLCAHVVLGLAVLFVAVPFMSGSLLTPYAVTTLAASGGYFLWGYSRLFPGRRVLGVLVGVGAVVLGGASWFMVMMLLLSWLRT